MNSVLTRAALVAMIATVALPALAVAKDVKRCGQRIHKGEVGVVLGDIACPSEVGSCSTDDSVACTSLNNCPLAPDGGVGLCGFDRIAIEKGGRLRLNGHTLSTSAPYNSALAIEGGALVEGPGTIMAMAPGGTAIMFGPSGKLVLRNLVIRDSGYGIVTGLKGTIDATNVSILDNTLGGVGMAKMLKGSNLIVSGNGSDPNAPGSLYGAGISALSVRVDGLTAEGNGGPGIDARKTVRLKNSTVTGNHGFGVGIDITSPRRPVLKDSTCGASGQVSEESALLGTWGVCTGD